MTTLVCKGCNKIIIEDVNEIDKSQEYLSCPYCNRKPFRNPYYDEKEIKKISYVG